MPWLPTATLTVVLPPEVLTRRFCLSQPGASSPKMWSKPIMCERTPSRERLGLSPS